MAFSFFGSRKTQTTPTPPPPPPPNGDDSTLASNPTQGNPIPPPPPVPSAPIAPADETFLDTTPPSPLSDDFTPDETQTLVITTPEPSQQTSMKDIHAPMTSPAQGIPLNEEVAPENLLDNEVVVEAEELAPAEQDPVLEPVAEVESNSEPANSGNATDDTPFILDVEDIMDESGPVTELVAEAPTDEDANEPATDPVNELEDPQPVSIPEVEEAQQPELEPTNSLPEETTPDPVEEATFSDEFKQEIKEMFDSETGKETEAIEAEENRLNQEQNTISDEEEEINRRLESIKKHQEELQNRKNELASNQTALAARKAKAAKVLDEL